MSSSFSPYGKGFRKRTVPTKSTAPVSTRRNQKGMWRGTALIVEVLIILVVVVACLAVFVRLFGYAYTSNAYDNHRARAITLASNEAEWFATQTDISPGEFTFEDDGYTISYLIEGTKVPRGTLYSATIRVSYDDQKLYTLKTASYVHDATDADAAANAADGTPEQADGAPDQADETAAQGGE